MLSDELRAQGWIEHVRWSLFRRLVRRFMRQRHFNRMIAVIAEEQQRCYYEDNYFDRVGQFDDAVKLAVRP